MKRIIVSCIACIMLMSAVANAEISKGKDNFTNGLNVSSFIQPEYYFDIIRFVKNLSDGIISFEFSISRTRNKENVLGNAPIEIKIDNDPVQELSDYRYKLTGPDSYGVNYNSVIDIKFPVELAEKIKNAKRVAIRYEDAMGMRWPYVLPDDVLSEWKQVINTTEWDILQDIEAQKSK